MENKDSYMIALLSSSRPFELLESKLQSLSLTPHSSAGVTASSRHSRAHATFSVCGVDIVHCPHRGIFAPTVIVPNYAQVVKLGDRDLLALAKELIRLVRDEADQGGWDVQEDANGNKEY